MNSPVDVAVTVVALDAEFDETLLSSAEQERAARYRFERGRKRWAAARCGLRRVLGTATDRNPAEVEFRVGAHGKPCLAYAGAPHFNLSHSEALALVAVCAERKVGTDIEAHNDRTEVDRVAERFFSPEEIQRLAGLDPATRRRRFFDLWSAKEAVLKCDGRGLGGVLLSSFSVDPGAAAPVSDRWWVSPVQVEAGYSAAVALDGVSPAEVTVSMEASERC